MIREFFAPLTAPLKSVFLISLLGVSVTAGLAVYSRHQLKQASQKEQEADRLRLEAQAAWKEAFRLKDYADSLKVALDKADAKLTKLQAAVDKIQVPPAPGPAPEQKQQLISDLKSMGLELVVKPSTMIAPSLVGITEGDGKTVWTWGQNSLRIPFFEQKIKAQTELINGLNKSKDLAEQLADSRAKQADAFEQSADLHRREADNLRIVVTDTKKALSAEKKKRLLYSVGALASGYFVHKELVR